MLVAAGFFALILLLWHPIEQPFRLLLFILAFFTIQFGIIFFHELGHLAAAILFRHLPATLVIGSGPKLAELTVWKLTFRFCSSTNEGCVFSDREHQQPSKFVTIASFAAGPIADLLVLATLIKLVFFPHAALAAHSFFESQIKPLLWVAGAYTSYYHLAYLLRRESYRADTRHSDARGIADALSFIPGSPAVQEAFNRLEKNFFACEGFPNEALPSDRDDLKTYTLWALSLPRITPDERRELYELFITATVLFGWTDNLPLADEYSRELLTNNTDVITYKGSRGSVLIDLGKLEEGKSLLEEVFSRTKSDFDRVISAAFLAIAEHRLGNPTAAQDWLARATAIDPSSLALKRARCLLEQNPTIAHTGASL